MYLNVATSSVGQANAAGLGALSRRTFVRRGGRALSVPIVLSRRRGMGDCISLPGSAFCRDNASGSVVACNAPACSVPASSAAGGGWDPTGPSFTPTPVTQNIPVGGFTGDLAVPTLASALGDMLADKESPFNANLIAKGVVNPSTDSQDFLALALDHCTEYAASQGCNNPQAVAAQFVAQYMAWLKGQSAAAYHAGDTGSLVSPAGLPVFVSHDPAVPPGGVAPASVSVVLSNVTRPGQTLRVGDTWRIDVSGPPSQPVAVSATQNGASLGTTPMGATNAQGTLSLSATGDAGVVGDWREVWTVGGAAAPVLAFLVSPAPAASAPQAPSGAGSPPAGSPPAGSQTNAPASGGGLALPGFLTQTFTVFGQTFPVWGGLAAGVGALFLLGGRK